MSAGGTTPDHWQQCIYCGWRAYEPGWGCHACGLCTTDDHDTTEATMNADSMIMPAVTG